MTVSKAREEALQVLADMRRSKCPISLARNRAMPSMCAFISWVPLLNTRRSAK